MHWKQRIQTWAKWSNVSRQAKRLSTTYTWSNICISRPLCVFAGSHQEPHRRRERPAFNEVVVRQKALHEKSFLQLFDSSLRSLLISVISDLNISKDYSDAEITEIRRDRREDLKSGQGLFLTTFRTRLGFPVVAGTSHRHKNSKRHNLSSRNSRSLALFG